MEIVFSGQLFLTWIMANGTCGLVINTIPDELEQVSKTELQLHVGA